MKHMEWIRKNYGVPAKRGGRIEWHNEVAKFIQGFLYKPKRGTIVSARGGYIRVRFDRETHITILHPTWNVKYL